MKGKNAADEFVEIMMRRAGKEEKEKAKKRKHEDKTRGVIQYDKLYDYEMKEVKIKGKTYVKESGKQNVADGSVITSMRMKAKTENDVMALQTVIDIFNTVQDDYDELNKKSKDKQYLLAFRCHNGHMPVYAKGLDSKFSDSVFIERWEAYINGGISGASLKSKHFKQFDSIEVIVVETPVNHNKRKVKNAFYNLNKK